MSTGCAASDIRCTRPPESLAVISWAPAPTCRRCLLDDDEAVAVALGLRTSASGGVTGIEEASVRALLKLEQVLPPRLRHRVAALHGFIVPLESRGPTVDAKLLSMIAGACRDYEGIRFKYNDRSGAPSMRAVEPHRLVHTGYRWYLVAWDIGRNDWRTFRVDRIEGKLKTSTRFKPRKPPEGDFATFVSEIALAGALSVSSPSHAARFRGEPCEPDSAVSRRARGTGSEFLHASNRCPFPGGHHHSPLSARNRFPGA